MSEHRFPTDGPHLNWDRRRQVPERAQQIRIFDKLQKGLRLGAGIRERCWICQEKGNLLEARMIALMGERSESCVTGHDVLNIPDDIVDELRDIGVCPERADLGFQEIHLIDDILGMHDTYGRISRTVHTIQSSTVNQVLKLGLDR